MSNWQERITRETPPAIVAEHHLRYRLVAPLIASSSVWADLGCGNGVASSSVLAGQLPDQPILVDLDHDAVAGAARELGSLDAIQITGDLTEPALLEEVGQRLLESDGDRVVSCFEVVEHLSTFVPLLEWTGALARKDAATFVLSVPNDAFWSIENPFHSGRWGEGAFEELRRLLPEQLTVLRQISLTGSAMAPWPDRPESYELTVEIGGTPTVASHFIAAFGPRHRELACGAVSVPVDQHKQRRWERQRESNLAFAEQKLEAQAQVLSTMIAERDEWRAYIHELERELGRPLSGVRTSPT